MTCGQTSVTRERQCRDRDAESIQSASYAAKLNRLNRPNTSGPPDCGSCGSDTKRRTDLGSL